MASVPVSGHASTQLAHPMHKEALITGLGLPFSAGSSPLDTCMAARWRFHMESAAPQAPQNAEPSKTGFEHRGQGDVVMACDGAAVAGAVAARLFAVSVFK
jgi:hypothetical protein